MAEQSLALQNENGIIRQQANSFQDAVHLLLYSLSDASKRQYQHTLKAWAAFCQANGLGLDDMNTTNLIAFLESGNLSHSTKQARLSHIRKLLESLHAASPDNPDFEAMYKQVKLLKIKRSNEEKQANRKQHRLQPMQILQSFSVWGEKNKLHARNRALLAVLLYGGLRRSEAAALQWDDIHLDEGLITVQHGKGDKSREVPILSDTLINYLKEWRDIVGEKKFVFCALRKGDKLGDDKPMTDTAIYDIIRSTGDSLGIEFLAPHDMRRTLITNALNAGASVADVQFIAGHSQASTTLLYAKQSDAKAVKGRVKNILPY